MQELRTTGPFMKLQYWGRNLNAHLVSLAWLRCSGYRAASEPFLPTQHVPCARAFCYSRLSRLALKPYNIPPGIRGGGLQQQRRIASQDPGFWKSKTQILGLQIQSPGFALRAAMIRSRWAPAAAASLFTVWSHGNGYDWASPKPYAPERRHLISSPHVDG